MWIFTRLEYPYRNCKNVTKTHTFFSPTTTKKPYASKALLATIIFNTFLRLYHHHTTVENGRKNNFITCTDKILTQTEIFTISSQ